MRDKARILAISEDNSASGWLKAVPIQSLGLTMVGAEFNTNLRSRPMDTHGDHLIECNHGPYRIRRHDALRDVVWHALQQDNASACREQRISGDCRDRPGDVYHPDFSEGKPTFFDISVRSSLQASSISQSSCNAGVAGSRGEMAKDEKHRQLVEDNGGIFIPLVVESFGLWTPFAKKILRSIAARTTIRNGLEEKTATRNSFQ